MEVNGLLWGSGLPAMAAIPSTVTWSYAVFTLIMVIGLAVITVRGDWQRARGVDKVLLLGPLFYVAPVAAFGTEHFTLAKAISSIVPKFMPWPLFWTYLVGACFIAAGLSVATRIQVRLTASLLALNFFLFVLMMDFPGFLRRPGNPFVQTLTLRELAFSGGALALAVSLADNPRDRWMQIFRNIARFFVGIPVVFYSYGQFLRGDHVPGVPLEPLTPTYVWGHAIWTYVAAVMYGVFGILLLLGIRRRMAATCVALTVLFIEIVVYVPIAVVEFASLEKGLNYMADTLMFCGAVMLLASAMPRESENAEARPAVEGAR